jgi:hypothetical protein
VATYLPSIRQHNAFRQAALSFAFFSCEGALTAPTIHEPIDRVNPNKQETPGVFRTEGFVCGGYVRSRSLGQIIHPTNIEGRLWMQHDSTSLADRTGAARTDAVVAVTGQLDRRFSPLQLGDSRDRLLRSCLRRKDRGTLDTGEMRGEHPGEIVSR